MSHRMRRASSDRAADCDAAALPARCSPAPRYSSRVHHRFRRGDLRKRAQVAQRAHTWQEEVRAATRRNEARNTRYTLSDRLRLDRERAQLTVLMRIVIPRDRIRIIIQSGEL